MISSPIVLSLFSGLGQLDESFLITKLPADPGQPGRYGLELLPREEQSSVSRIAIWVDATSYHIVRIQTEDPLGNVNDISFTNIQVNIPLDLSLFALQVPEGVRLERQQVKPPS